MVTTNAQCRAYYRRNAEKTRLRCRRKNWRNWGIDPDEAQRALDNHDGKCRICRATKPGGRGTWHIDHDHKTKKIRGVLCLRCNAGIGQLKEDPAVILRAARYLQGRLRD